MIGRFASMHNNNSTALGKRKFKNIIRWALIVVGLVLSVAWIVLLTWFLLHLMKII